LFSLISHAPQFVGMAGINSDNAKISLILFLTAVKIAAARYQQIMVFRKLLHFLLYFIVMAGMDHLYPINAGRNQCFQLFLGIQSAWMSYNHDPARLFNGFYHLRMAVIFIIDRSQLLITKMTDKGLL